MMNSGASNLPFSKFSRQMSIDLIKRVEACGFEAIVLTLDAQFLGKRRVTIRNQFQPPKHIR